MKKESVAEFLARGGKITVCPKGEAKQGKRKRATSAKTEQKEEVNYAVIPANLKIALGIKC